MRMDVWFDRQWDTLLDAKGDLTDLLKVADRIAGQYEKAGFIPFLQLANFSPGEDGVGGVFTPQFQQRAVMKDA